MPLFTASTRHLYRVLLVCLIHWNVSVHGQWAEAAVHPEIVKLKLDFLKGPLLIRRNDIPKVSSLGLSRCGSRSTSLCTR